MLIFTILAVYQEPENRWGLQWGVNLKGSGLYSQQMPLRVPASAYSFRNSSPLLVRNLEEPREEDLNLGSGGE